jgi:hypothetical protein
MANGGLAEAIPMNGKDNSPEDCAFPCLKVRGHHQGCPQYLERPMNDESAKSTVNDCEPATKDTENVKCISYLSKRQISIMYCNYVQGPERDSDS